MSTSVCGTESALMIFFDKMSVADEIQEEDVHYDPGSDPDMVAGEQPPERALKSVEVEAGTRHEGSILPLLEGNIDVEVASVMLTPEQVERLVSLP